MLILIIGGVGTGKTVLSVILAAKSRRRVFSNFQIYIPRYGPLDLSKLVKLEYQNCELLLDEAYVYLEARMAMSKINQYLSYLLFQSRKKSINLVLTAQLSSTIDNRFRQLADYVIMCEKSGGGFRYTVINNMTGDRRSFHLSKSKVERFFALYDTYEVIHPRNDPFDFLPPDQKASRLTDIGNQLFAFYQRVPTLKEGKLWAIGHDIAPTLVDLALTDLKTKHRPDPKS